MRNNFSALHPPSNFGRSCSIGDYTHREPGDYYHGVIVQADDRWRVIICRSNLQYILQRRSAKPLNKGLWIGKHYCTTLDCLISVCSTLGLLSDANTEAVLHALPDRARDYRRN